MAWTRVGSSADALTLLLVRKKCLSATFYVLIVLLIFYGLTGKDTVLNTQYEMKDHKLAGLATLKNFKEPANGTRSSFSSYI